MKEEPKSILFKQTVFEKKIFCFYNLSRVTIGTKKKAYFILGVDVTVMRENGFVLAQP